MKHFVLRPLCTIAILVTAVLANAQQTSFADVANGVTAPASIKIADLTADYKAMRIQSAGEATPGLMGSMGGLMMMGMMGGGQNSEKLIPAFFQLGALADSIWTKGQTVSLSGHDFLIGYRLNTGLDPAFMTGPTPKLAANLTLDLIRTDTVISIAPDPNLTGDQLRKVLTAAGVEFDTAPLHLEMGRDDSTQAGMLYPIFAQAREAAQTTTELSNAKQITLATLIYCSDYDDVLPYVSSTDQFRKVTEPYSKSDAIWKDDNPSGGRFLFAMNLAGVSQTAITEMAKAPLVYESKSWPDGKRAVGFADGHAKRVTEQEWSQIEPYLEKRYPRAAKKPIKGR